MESEVFNWCSNYDSLNIAILPSPSAAIKVFSFKNLTQLTLFWKTENE
jgi:hypothetical protein